MGLHCTHTITTSHRRTMKTCTLVLALVAAATMVSVGEARLGRTLLNTNTNDDADDIEPSQLFMIVCLSIGAFVMLVALIACLLVLKRYSGAATTTTAAGPSYAQGPGMVALGGQPMMMPMMMQPQPMMTPFMMQPGVKPAAPMPDMAPAVQAQAPMGVQPISAASQARMVSQDRAEVAGVHGSGGQDGVAALVNQASANMAADAQGGDGSGHGFQAHVEA